MPAGKQDRPRVSRGLLDFAEVLGLALRLVVILPRGALRPGRYQPRREMDPDRLEELAASIRANGVMQPIVARELPSGSGHEIIAGERRWRTMLWSACTLAPSKLDPVMFAPANICVCRNRSVRAPRARLWVSRALLLLSLEGHAVKP